MLYIFLDDERKAPCNCWTVVRDVPSFLELIDNTEEAISAISFDHDLGTIQNGYDAMCELEFRVFQGKMTKIPVVNVHTANPSVLKKMLNAGKNICSGSVSRADYAGLRKICVQELTTQG